MSQAWRFFVFGLNWDEKFIPIFHRGVPSSALQQSLQVQNLEAFLFLGIIAQVLNFSGKYVLRLNGRLETHGPFHPRHEDEDEWGASSIWRKYLLVTGHDASIHWRSSIGIQPKLNKYCYCISQWRTVRGWEN